MIKTPEQFQSAILSAQNEGANRYMIKMEEGKLIIEFLYLGSSHASGGYAPRNRRMMNSNIRSVISKHDLTSLPAGEEISKLQSI